MVIQSIRLHNNMASCQVVNLFDLTPPHFGSLRHWFPLPLQGFFLLTCRK
jgi:hypothetical protein